MLNIKWLQDSIEKGYFLGSTLTTRFLTILDEEPYTLCDEEAEGKWNFTFKKSRELALEHQEAGLFGSCLFGLTPIADKKDIRKIIELNGGTVVKR